ncbi:MAG: hypothetical protein V7L01_07795 [Nostoc sp.]|uniref:hypothetical protein n=1 Tax=Nostoc sp. TaxID=1180 RepID=UPI002FF83373
MTKKQNIVQQNRRRKRRGLKIISGRVISAIAAPLAVRKGATVAKVALSELAGESKENAEG